MGLISDFCGGLSASAEAAALATSAGAAWYLFVGRETLRSQKRRKATRGVP